ncbi:MAG TPA: hypothetical protein VKB86_11520 [Pyrinomonadaceae bacterium]|nr:hypothetical protein [Pyrinomonadaceae bacterium]
MRAYSAGRKLGADHLAGVGLVLMVGAIFMVESLLRGLLIPASSMDFIASTAQRALRLDANGEMKLSNGSL